MSSGVSSPQLCSLCPPLRAAVRANGAIILGAGPSLHRQAQVSPRGSPSEGPGPSKLVSLPPVCLWTLSGPLDETLTPCCTPRSTRDRVAHTRASQCLPCLRFYVWPRGGRAWPGHGHGLGCSRPQSHLSLAEAEERRENPNKTRAPGGLVRATALCTPDPPGRP